MLVFPSLKLNSTFQNNISTQNRKKSRTTLTIFRLFCECEISCLNQTCTLQAIGQSHNQKQSKVTQTSPFLTSRNTCGYAHGCAFTLVPTVMLCYAYKIALETIPKLPGPAVFVRQEPTDRLEMTSKGDDFVLSSCVLFMQKSEVQCIYLHPVCF